MVYCRETRARSLRNILQKKSSNWWCLAFEYFGHARYFNETAAQKRRCLIIAEKIFSTDKEFFPVGSLWNGNESQVAVTSVLPFVYCVVPSKSFSIPDGRGLDKTRFDVSHQVADADAGAKSDNDVPFTQQK